MVLWFFGLILAGGWGYASQYFWASGCLLAIGCAVAPFWRRRASKWYLPTVALLVCINAAVLYVARDYIALRDLPSKYVLAAMLVIDCIACWLVMVGIAYLSEHKAPWSN
jgi:hypothetical protein